MVDVYIPEQEHDSNLQNSYFDYAKAGTLDVLGATLDETMYYNPANALGRLSEQYIGQGRTGRLLSSDEWASSEYFREGITVDEDGITEGLAELFAQRHDERQDFRTTLQRSRGGFGLGAAQFGVALAGSLLDPLNVASAFIPSVGLARLGVIGSRTGGHKFMTGVMDGAIGAAVVEPLVIGAAVAEQDQDYGLMDSFLNVALGAALGGGLHWGVGKITERINRTPPETRQTAQNTSIGQAVSDQEITAGRLVEDAETSPFDPVPGDEKMVVYNPEGKGRVVDVVRTDAEGEIVIRDIDGAEKIVNASDVRAKSPFDEDYLYDLGDGSDELQLSALNDEQLSNIEEMVENQLEIAKEANDIPALTKAQADKKAIEIQRKRNAGEDVERPADPEQVASAEQQIAKLKAENQKIKEDIEKRRVAEGLDKPKVKMSEVNKVAENEQKIAALESQLSKSSDVAVQQQDQLTPQQAEDKIEEAGTVNLLGRLGEFKDKADEIEAQSDTPPDLDPVALEQEVQLMETGLRESEEFDLLPEEIRSTLRFNELDEKVEAYEDVVEAGRFCVVGSK